MADIFYAYLALAVGTLALYGFIRLSQWRKDRREARAALREWNDEIDAALAAFFREEQR